ncbi:MAG: divalent-cation tolerance protein CutA [Candidatus Bathyarchaeota archaeon]|nr:divalent-cation tolerance protein CutA [Candidatus Bathyarchaeota archaeon]
MLEYLQVVTVVGSKEDAERISALVVERRLAACSQVLGPITSIYWWKGKVERAEEWMCLMKSRDETYQDLESTIRQNHPYEIPEILALQVAHGDKSYLEWLNSELDK